MIWMTANFLDVMIIDADSVSYALSVMPTLDRSIILSRHAGADPGRAVGARSAAGTAAYCGAWRCPASRA